MIVQQFTVGPIAENCWLLADETTRQAVLVDPGDEADRLLAAVDATGCTLVAIWLTHAHFDHIGAVADIVRQRQVTVHLHPDDREWYDHAHEAGLRFGVAVETPPPPDAVLAEGDTVSCGSLRFNVWHLPGHSPGHVAFIGHDLCVSGDVLFEGSIGRTDLPRCSLPDLLQSLRRLTTLPPETRVLPGHGGYTDIGREIASNPFLSPQYTS